MSTRRTRSVFEFASVRHRTTYSLALILTCAAVWRSPAAVTATAVLRIALTVRVYQTAGLPSALEPAGTVLRAALVDVRWQECTGLNASPTCDVPPGPSELLLVVREGAACQDTPATLGKALVVCRAGGVLATVNVNCVARLATASRTDVAVLLGRVAAHGLGHLMMRNSSHARGGLMRPNWTPDEVRRNRAADWAFTAADVAAMRQPGTEDWRECGSDLRSSTLPEIPTCR
jgi:hypothetical protein